VRPCDGLRRSPAPPGSPAIQGSNPSASTQPGAAHTRQTQFGPDTHGPGAPLRDLGNGPLTAFPASRILLGSCGWCAALLCLRCRSGCSARQTPPTCCPRNARRHAPRQLCGNSTSTPLAVTRRGGLVTGSGVTGIPHSPKKPQYLSPLDGLATPNASPGLDRFRGCAGGPHWRRPAPRATLEACQIVPSPAAMIPPHSYRELVSPNDDPGAGSSRTPAQAVVIRYLFNASATLGSPVVPPTRSPAAGPSTCGPIRLDQC